MLKSAILILKSYIITYETGQKPLYFLAVDSLQ